MEKIADSGKSAGESLGVGNVCEVKICSSNCRLKFPT